jgi:hypothetical protein
MPRGAHCRPVAKTPYPSAVTSLEPQALAATIIDRISTASGIFLQPGFLADVIHLGGDTPGRTYHDIPVAWTELTDFVPFDFLQVTLEYGDFENDSLHVKRQHNVFGEEPDAFIHPVIRRIQNGKIIDEVHLADHLDADWRPRGDRPVSMGTVLQMTFQDAGTMVDPADVAREQLETFLQRSSLGMTAQSAAE